MTPLMLFSYYLPSSYSHHCLSLVIFFYVVCYLILLLWSGRTTSQKITNECLVWFFYPNLSLHIQQASVSVVQHRSHECCPRTGIRCHLVSTTTTTDHIIFFVHTRTIHSLALGWMGWWLSFLFLNLLFINTFPTTDGRTDNYAAIVVGVLRLLLMNIVILISMSLLINTDVSRSRRRRSRNRNRHRCQCGLGRQ